MSSTLDGGLGKVCSSAIGLESKSGPAESGDLQSSREGVSRGMKWKEGLGRVSKAMLVLLTRVLWSPTMRVLCQPLPRTKRSPGPDDDNKLAGAHCQGTANLL